MQLLLALLFLSAIVFVFLLSGMITRWSAAPPVAATPEPFRWVAPLAVTAEPTAPPPTIAPSSMSAAVGEERREFSAAIALMSDDERCLEIAFLSAPVSPEAKEVLSGSSGLMRSPEVGATLVARVNFASPTKICATTELRSYVMVFVGGATGFALPQGLPRLELFRSQTWGRSQEMVALECDQFEEHSVRGVFRATAQSEGVPVQWDLPFWAPLVRSRERFCGSVVPQ